MIDAGTLIRQAVMFMWIASAFALGFSIYALFMRNKVLIDMTLGVWLSYAIVGIVLGGFASHIRSMGTPPGVR